jgi:hypothetical protein
MAQLRGPAKAAGFSQGDEIFKPFGFHGQDYARNAWSDFVGEPGANPWLETGQDALR